MDRRIAPLFAFVVTLVLGSVASGAAEPAMAPLAVTTWPPSTLLVSEVQTGGASASDEFAEITNAAAVDVDLAGLELVYVTSTGGTVTRKAAWSAGQALTPGQHLFVANSSGIYAPLADATYSGGFAATGGALVLRPIGGAPIDAVGWGDASNGFVEGAAAVAPSAGASIERLPGGLGGNTQDTNANDLDWFVQAVPNPQSLAAPPVPAPVGTPPPSETPDATATPEPSPSGAPSAEPTGVPTADPTIGPTVPPTTAPSPAATTLPTPAPTIAPTPSSPATPAPTVDPTATPSPPPTAAPSPPPTATPTATPSPPPTATPSPPPAPSVPIAEARALPPGATATVSGILTTPLGALESGHKAFLQDESGGIALYLDVAVVDGLPAGTVIVATGIVDERFAERTLRVTLAAIDADGAAALPEPFDVATGGIGEAAEGWRVSVQGLTVGSPSSLSDGLGLMVDDGTGQVRVIVGLDALGGASVPGGTFVRATGSVGQRDSTGTGASGYRIHVTQGADFTILPTPTPTPTTAPSASPMPTPQASPAPTNTPAPTAAPTQSPLASLPPVVDIAAARTASVGTVVSVAGVVTAEAGRLGLPPLIAIADATGGIAVRLPDGVAAPARGATVLVHGPLADPYGQLELRPAATGFSLTGWASLPSPLALSAADLDEATEGRLAELSGTVTGGPRKSTSGDLSVDLVDAAGTPFRVVADASSGIDAADLVAGGAYRLTGIVGQRASRKGALDGYRLYPRDIDDVVGIAALDGGPGGADAPATLVATAAAAPEGATVTIEAIVTAGAALLDTSGRRIVVQDASGAIEVLLPSGAAAPSIGTRVRVTGTTRRAWDAPRLAATAVEVIGTGSVTPLALARPPAERDEWLLVRLSGTVEKVERVGDRWRADVLLPGGARAVVQGQAGAGIPSTAILAGRRITAVGIVKRPYPTATDRRFAVLPRGGPDVSIGPDSGGGSDGPIQPRTSASADRTGSAVDITPDTDLAVLGEHVGERVRVGGLIVGLAERGFDLDDGTAMARIELQGELAALLPLLRAGEPVAVTGVVELRSGSAMVVAGDEGSLLRVGSLGQALPVGAAAAPASPPADDGGALVADAALLGPGLAPTSLAAIAALSLLSLAATVARRRLMQHRLRTVLVRRLATLQDPNSPPRAAGTGAEGASPRTNRA